MVSKQKLKIKIVKAYLQITLRDISLLINENHFTRYNLNLCSISTLPPYHSSKLPSKLYLWWYQSGAAIPSLADQNCDGISPAHLSGLVPDLQQYPLHRYSPTLNSTQPNPTLPLVPCCMLFMIIACITFCMQKKKLILNSCVSYSFFLVLCGNTTNIISTVFFTHFIFF